MKHVSCSCGYVARAETGEELLAAVEAHIAAVHAPEWNDTEDHTNAAGADGLETSEKQ